MKLKTTFLTATAIAFASGVLLGCASPRQNASNALTAMLQEHDSKTADLEAVGEILVSRYGLNAAGNAVLDMWVKLTNNQSVDRAGDVMWLLDQSPRVRDVAWLIKYQSEWLK